ncbi:hypothetical protein [Amycolatopsis sp. CA-230715]|uniref:hypothetical protein n=1 Tax=Amycolatopsis sp. CA-230715 TaxID=2745196 RepID=UPI001C0156D4|nr:hypothetical protein [Amycolatopsis sp. CA-230715]QWF81432.1 hypothetical protein HUW46_04864 [Amycolatopsis sp. CA-230715]
MAKHSSEESGQTSGSGVPLGDGGDSVAIVQNARNRSDGFDIGEDRAIGALPNWDAQGSTELYRGATVNNDPSTAESTGHAWTGHGKELHQAANDLYNAISELGSVWVGQGAAAAQGTLVGIANSSSQAGEAAHSMGTRLAQQAAAAAEVKKMPAPKEFDPQASMTAMLAGGPAAMIADQKAQFDAAKDVKAQQVAYFNAYTKAMSEVDNTTPSFGPESLGLPPHAGGARGTSANVSAAHVTGANIGAGGVGTGGGSFATNPILGTGAEGQHTTQAGYQPPAPHGPEAGAVSGSGSAHAPAPAPNSGGSVGQQLGLAGVGGGLGLAAGRTLAAGNRSGSTKQKQSDETSASADNQQGNSATANAPQGPAVVSPAGTIGGGQQQGMAPMSPGMGAHGAHAQEDEEHTHASFLIEPDPDDAFGANQATPPPVIGAWSDDEEG